MNTREIDRTMRDDPFASKFYAGTYALDQLPQQLKANSLYIMNLSKISHEGSHWVQIGTVNGSTFFDSFGRPPPQEIIANLLSVGGEILWSDAVVQSPISQSCGYHVLLVSFLQARGYSMHEILSQFYQVEDRDYLRNDTYATEVISSLTALEERPVVDWSNFY